MFGVPVQSCGRQDVESGVVTVPQSGGTDQLFLAADSWIPNSEMTVGLNQRCSILRDPDGPDHLSGPGLGLQH